MSEKGDIIKNKKSKATTAMLKGLVKPGWLRDCVLVSMNKLGEKHVQRDGQANTIKALAFDLLSARFEK